MAGLGVAVCSYNMLGDTDVCWSNQSISQGLVNKIKHSDITWPLKEVRCAWEWSQEYLYIIPKYVLNRDMGIQIEWKCSQCWRPGRLVWLSGKHELGSNNRGVGNEQFRRTRFPDFCLISPVISLKNDVIVVKMGGAGGLGWFLSSISRKSALISHDFNLISTDFSTRCTRFLSLPTPRTRPLSVGGVAESTSLEALPAKPSHAQDKESRFRPRPTGKKKKSDPRDFRYNNNNICARVRKAELWNSLLLQLGLIL